jgi:hypothetical protein
VKGADQVRSPPALPGRDQPGDCQLCSPIASTCSRSPLASVRPGSPALSSLSFWRSTIKSLTNAWGVFFQCCAHGWPALAPVEQVALDAAGQVRALSVPVTTPMLLRWLYLFRLRAQFGCARPIA